MPKVTVKLFNGNTIELDGDLSVEQIRSVLTAAGIANLSGASAQESITDGVREVSFSAPVAATKGL